MVETHAFYNCLKGNFSVSVQVEYAVCVISNSSGPFRRKSSWKLHHTQVPKVLQLLFIVCLEYEFHILWLCIVSGVNSDF